MLKNVIIIAIDLCTLTGLLPFSFHIIDSLNRVIKVEEVNNESTHHHPHTETTVAARRFYAQRNMYVSVPSSCVVESYNSVTS